jgi:hypothetical protein
MSIEKITDLLVNIQNDVSQLQQDIVNKNYTYIYNETDDSQSEPQDIYISDEVIESCRLGDKIIDTCNDVLKNVEEIKTNFNEEKSRLCVLINTISQNLPFIERVKIRAEARGVKLGDFTLSNIPKEATPFYSDDERIYAVIREYESEMSRSNY